MVREDEQRHVASVHQEVAPMFHCRMNGQHEEDHGRHNTLMGVANVNETCEAIHDREDVTPWS